MSRKATKLTKLRLKEISGVDAAANEVGGWIVAKATEFKRSVEDVEKAVVGTFEGLTSDELDAYLTGAPEAVLKARKTLAEHIANDIEEDPTVAQKSESGKSAVAQRITDLFKSNESPEETGGAEGETDGAEESEESEEQTGGEQEQGQTSEEAGSGDGDGDEGNEPSDDGAGDGGSGAEEEPEGEAGESGRPDGEAGEIAKAVAAVIPGVVRDEVRKALNERESEVAKAQETVAEAVGAIADRMETVEKHLAGQTGLDGQDGLEAPEGAEGESGLGKAIRSAVVNGRVELT